MLDLEEAEQPTDSLFVAAFEDQEEQEPPSKRARAKQQGPERRGRSPPAAAPTQLEHGKKQPRSSSAPARGAAPAPKKVKTEVQHKLKCWRCLNSPDKTQWAKHKKHGAWSFSC